MNEVIITYLALPMSVNGLVTPTPEGDYQVILNARHSPQMQRETYRHELRHILLNHFSQDAAALAPLEEAASLMPLPGGRPGENVLYNSAQSAFLEEIISRAEDNGLSSADFARRDAAPAADGPLAQLPGPDVPVGANLSAQLPVPDIPAEPALPPVAAGATPIGPLLTQTQTEPALAVGAVHEPPALPVPHIPVTSSATDNTTLLRALRAQLTGLHY